jgi:hypothetical protein
MPKKHKKDDVTAPANKLAATCMDIKDDKECVKRGSKEGECAWCSGKFLPSGCLGVDKAKYIPEQVGYWRKFLFKRTFAFDFWLFFDMIFDLFVCCCENLFAVARRTQHVSKIYAKASDICKSRTRRKHID